MSRVINSMSEKLPRRGLPVAVVRVEVDEGLSGRRKSSSSRSKKERTTFTTTTIKMLREKCGPTLLERAARRKVSKESKKKSGASSPKSPPIKTREFFSKSISEEFCALSLSSSVDLDRRDSEITCSIHDCDYGHFIDLDDF
mmetsp:Transcript_705/g.890  ORF Transcript_705/g.890 Transcript_705/m.890 type:complete len:142 (+) Transcript_705:87-512(+)